MKCSICKQEIYTDRGHNAEPINSGRCCAVCNATAVVPMRLRMFFDSVNRTKEIEESVKENINENNDGI